MNLRRPLLTALILAAVPALCFAQEAAEAVEAPSPFSGNVGNAVWTLVIFVLVVVVLGKFAWGPVLDLLKTRENFIHDALSAAKREKEAAQASLAEYTEKLRAARLEAAAIIQQSRDDATRLRDEMRQKAKAEADGIVRAAERQIQLETERALQQIRHEAIDLSVMIASKLIQRNLTKEDNDRLIAEALRQVEGQKH